MYVDDGGIWDRMRYFARQYGKPLEELDDMFGLEHGSIAFMAENGIAPDEELIKRFSLFTGRSVHELTYGVPPCPKVEVRRPVFVLRDAAFLDGDYNSIDEISTRVFMDFAGKDKSDYIMAVVRDDSMSRAHIFKGDIVLLRRQLVAEDGDIVAAGVNDGCAILRRYHCNNDDIWIDAEGPITSGKRRYSDSITNVDRKIHIYGKVVRVIRDFENTY